MAEENTEQDRSEAATPFKLDRARRRGMLARGTDLGFLSALVAFAVIAQMSGEELVRGLGLAMRRILLTASTSAGEAVTMQARAGELSRTVVAGFALPVFVLLCLCVAIEIVQNRGLVFTAQPLKPDFSRLNPAKGLKRLFSRRLLTELAKSILKFAVYGGAAWLLIDSQAREIASAARNGSRVADLMVEAAGRLLLLFIVIAAAFAILDQLLVRREFARQMRMSRREVTREAREREGEPRQKQKRRQILTEILAQAAAAANVKGADVLIVNPTHYAIALRYREGESEAPIIRARGRNAWAQRMRRVAEREGIVIIRNPTLARALYNETRVGQQVGGRHFVSVADIYIMLRRAMRSSERG